MKNHEFSELYLSVLWPMYVLRHHLILNGYEQNDAVDDIQCIDVSISIYQKHKIHANNFSPIQVYAV
jgi:hypothetical protein